jgi:hypothetical protein
VPKHTELPLFRVLLDGLVAGRILEAALRKGFGWFVLAMGAFVLIQRAPVDLRGPIALASPEPPSLRPQSVGSSLAARAEPGGSDRLARYPRGYYRC